MSAAFRAVDEPRASRLDYRQQVIHDQLVPMDVHLEDGPDARDELVTGEIGALRVVEWSTGPGRTHRSAKHIRGADHDLYQVFVHGGGRVVGKQDGRQNELGPGDIAIVDPARPLRCVHTAHRGVLVAFPRSMTSLRAVRSPG